MSDGSLIFDTKLDNSGFEQGMQELEKTGVAAGATVEKNLSQSLSEAVTELSAQVLAAAREKSTDYETLGSLYVSAMKSGIDQSKTEAITAVKELVNARIAAYKEATDAETAEQVAALRLQAKSTGSYGKQLIQNQITELQTETDNAQRAYTTAAKSILTAFTEQLRTSADEAKTTVSEALGGLVEEYQSAYEELVREQDNLEERLANYGDMTDLSGDGTVLSKIEMSVRALDEYEKMLQGLREAGASDDLLRTVARMDIDEGLSFGNALLGLGQVRLGQYMEAWEEQQRRAKEISDEFYGQSLEQLDTEFTQKLRERLNLLPGELGDIGQAAMVGFLEGLENKKPDVLATAADIAQAVKDEIASAFEIHSPSRWMKREIGENLALGLEEGFTGAMPGVQAEMARSALAELSGAAAELGTGTIAVDGASVGQTVRESSRETVVKEKVVGVRFTGTGAELARLLRPQLEREQTRAGQRFTKTGGI